MMIDKQAREEVQKNMRNALGAMWDHIQKNGLQKQCQDHYSFMWKFLDDMDNWPATEVEMHKEQAQVVVNGTLYTPKEGG